MPDSERFASTRTAIIEQRSWRPSSTYIPRPLVVNTRAAADSEIQLNQDLTSEELGYLYGPTRFRTLCWRERDSNPRPPVRETALFETARSTTSAIPLPRQRTVKFQLRVICGGQLKRRDLFFMAPSPGFHQRVVAIRGGPSITGACQVSGA